VKKIPAIDPDDASTLYDLGVNYQSMNNKKEASISFNRYKRIVTEVFMKKWPDDPGTYISMSEVMAHLGEMDSSKLMLLKAIKIDSTLHEKFAEALCLQGNVPEALNHLEKAFNTGYRNLFWLKLNPDLQLLRYDTRYRDLIIKYFK
jgi:tetratricopeptide (TPR) repeat protein